MLVVLPTYNEAENLSAISTAILAATDRIEILIVGAEVEVEPVLDRL